MKKYITIITIAIVLFFFGACSSASVSLSIPGARKDKPVDSKPEIISKQECGYQLLDFIPLGTNDLLQRAFRSVQMRATGAYVENIAVDHIWYYGFVGTFLCTEVSATVYR